MASSCPAPSAFPPGLPFLRGRTANWSFDRKNSSEQLEFDLENLPSRGKGVWSDYVLGIAVMLQEIGHPTPGASLLVRGEVPIGAGLSSSAAIEVASALALMSLNGARLSLPEVAKLCQRAENVFIGARVGIMDQFVSCLGKAGHALLLDCRSLEFKLIPIPEDVRLVICNTMVKHDHASGAYNRRREECDEGVKILSRWYPQARALRDISLEQLEQHKAEIPADRLQALPARGDGKPARAGRRQIPG